MPLYEGLGVVSEKYSIILDIGHAYTKCGFARETGPRRIIRSEVKHPQTNEVVNIWDYKDIDELYLLIKEFLHVVYFKCLVVNPKERRLLIVESVLCPTTFRDCLAKVLFEHYEVPSLLFVPSHLMALFTLGIQTGLVLESGYSETTVLPIYEGVPILNACEVLPVGGQAIHRRILAELMDKATVTTSEPNEKPLDAVLSKPLHEVILEDIKVRTCIVSPIERGKEIQAYEAQQRLKGPLTIKRPPPPADIEYPLDGEHIMKIPGSIREWATEILFERDEDDQSIATLLLDSLLKCSIDTRKALVANIVMMGGTTMLQGFGNRLLTEVRSSLKDPEYCQQLPIKEVKVHMPPAKGNYIAWLGASMFGATDSIVARTVTRDLYLKNKYIPDWSDQKWNEINEKSEKSVA